jgi:N-acetylmuramoyl-L-alanine amidase
MYTGGGNEEAVMRQVAAIVFGLLDASTADIQLHMCGIKSWQDNVAESNAWGADYHYSLHTNAGGGHGTEVFHRTGSTVGLRMATKLYNRVAPVSNMSDRGIKPTTSLGELNNTHAPACLIEILFHDNLAEAAEMKKDIRLFATAIALGILDEVGGKLASAAPVLPATYRHVAGWAEDTASRKKLNDLCDKLGVESTVDGPAFEFHASLTKTKQIEALIAAEPKLHRFHGVLVAAGTHKAMGVADGIGTKTWSVTVGS